MNEGTFYEDVDDCIAGVRPHALCVPWVKDSRKSLLAAHAGLKARGWIADADGYYRRGGWVLFLRSQGELGSPIAQFNRADWADREIDGWGLMHCADGSILDADEYGARDPRNDRPNTDDDDDAEDCGGETSTQLSLF